MLKSADDGDSKQLMFLKQIKKKLHKIQRYLSILVKCFFLNLYFL